MKKLFYSFLAVSMMAFGFAACNDDNGGEGGEGGKDGAKISESDLYGNWMSDTIVVSAANIDEEKYEMYDKSPVIVTITKDKHVILYGSDTLGVWSLKKGVITVNGTTSVYDPEARDYKEEPVEVEITVVSYGKDKGVITIKNAEQYVYNKVTKKEETLLADETVYFSRLREPKGDDLAINKTNVTGTWKLLYSKYESTENGRKYSDMYPAHESVTLTINSDGTFVSARYYGRGGADDNSHVEEGVWSLKQNKILLYYGEKMTPDQLDTLPDEYWENARTISRLTSDFLVLSSRYEWTDGQDSGYSEDEQYYVRAN
ncbi:MAG: lipocalin family protein [Bacteroidales bacterium]|nr:lipocalin family protein [Bacteroidales bacterium]